MLGLLGLTVSQANQMKKYEVKSAKIEYDLKGSGDIMSMVKIKSVGKKRVIFDDYGVKHIEEKSEVKKETTMGETKVKKTHTLKYMNDNIIYSVDFKKKKIMRMKNPASAMMGMFGGGSNMQETGEKMMKKMGGNKLGTDKVLGYSCDVWDLMGVKQCIYKGIPLKIESDMMGMKSIEIATKAEFDLSLSLEDFKLPDFPVYSMDTDNGITTEISKNKLEAMDARDNKKAKEESKEAAQGMEAMGAGLAALAKAGIDMNKELTPEQEKIMQKAMMGAMSKSMGGEDKMLAKIKADILGGSKVEEMHFAKECFGSADTLKEANSCVDKGNQKFNDDEEYFNSWTKSDKQEMLNDMKMFEKMIPCIKAAQSIDAFQNCMPKEMR